MRVLIADDHALFRDGLRSLLEAHDFEVVGEAADGREAVEMAREHRPDVVLMDLAMPGVDGLQATRELAEELPEVKVLVLTASEEESDLFEAIRQGARGYLLKDLRSDRFFELLEGLGRGEPAITPALARKLLDEFSRTASVPQHAGGPSELTDREREVLEHMVRGVTTNRELAAELGVTENTIKFHMQHILEKLHLHTRAEVVAFALRTHMVDSDEDGEEH